MRIKEKLSPVSFRIALPADSKIHDVVSVAHLQKYGEDDGTIRPLPIETEFSEEKEWYEVEAIMGERIMKGRKEYLVKWKGYGENESSWEDEKDVNAPDKLKEWDVKKKKMKIANTSTTSTNQKRSLRSKPKTPKRSYNFTVFADTTCLSCQSEFTSRNTLFKHLAEVHHHF